MSFVLQPLHLVFVALSGWVNQRQRQIIEFQNAEIEALLKKLGKKRVLLTNDKRRLLAVLVNWDQLYLRSGNRPTGEATLANYRRCDTEGAVTNGVRCARHTLATCG